MQTTLRIDDDLYRQAKAKAALLGISLNTARKGKLSRLSVSISMAASNTVTAEETIRLFKLEAHPEGGYYRETFRDSKKVEGRSASTAIYFLLKRGEISRWHRIDSVEVWHWYTGAPIRLQIQVENGPIEPFLLGSDFLKNERPQVIVPAQAWQTAETLGDWTLVGCTVAPGFEFEKFELLKD